MQYAHFVTNNLTTRTSQRTSYINANLRGRETTNETKNYGKKTEHA